MPTADELRAMSKKPDHELGTCEMGCGCPGRYEHVDEQGRRWHLCWVHWHKAQEAKT
jgi:hypothetical protein